MRFTAVSLLAAAAIAGCASTQEAADAELAPDSQEIVATGATQYDGQFRPIQQNDGRMGMTTAQRIFGNVRVIYREATERTAITLNITTNFQQTEILAWAIVPGRCGSGGVPILPATQFPPLEISTNGRGEVSVADMQLALNRASYHVNVYRGGETLSNVIACANLTTRN